MHEAVQEIKDILSGRPGGVNRFLRRWSSLVIDYATALIPDRTEPFDRLIEDIFVDAVSQCRAASRLTTEEEVRTFLVESALRTVRARYRETLETKATPTKATTTLSFKEVVEQSKETEETLHEAISSGRIRAVRTDDQMRVDAKNVPGLKGRKAALAYHVSTAERELLCLHHRLGYTPDDISQWSDRSPASLESLINTASAHLAQRIEANSKRGPEPEDAEMRRYIEGRLSSTDTVKFEQKVLMDKVAQERISELRSESDHIRDLFKTSPYDLSRTAIHVRQRNPHRTLVIPPSVSLWIQVAALVVIVLMLHNVGAYISPPSIEIKSVTGAIAIDGSHGLDSLHNGKLVVGQSIETKFGAQALVVIDSSNSIRMAEETSLKILEPRKTVRQVIDVNEGEIWGKFVSSGQAFAIGFGTSSDSRFELTSSKGAEFDLAVGKMALQVMPDNLAIDGAGSSEPVLPVAVLRVFRGVVLTGQVNQEFQPVGRDQWVVYFNDGNSFAGHSGIEDFRMLRYEAGDRYKDRLHWLNTKQYPLQGQTSLLTLDRKLRAIAADLEELRITEVVRDGANEIKIFREQIEEVMAEAKTRVSKDKGRKREPKSASLSDAELIAARNQIVGDIDFWLKQASSGAYPTLGDAAKILIHPINKDKSRMNELDERIGDAIIRRDEITKLEEVISNIENAIKTLKEHKLTDIDGSKRASLQAKVDEQNKKILAGREAKGNIEILNVRLNKLDGKIDDKRRQLPALRKEKETFEVEISDLTKAVSGNRYTDDLFNTTSLSLKTSEETLVTNEAALRTANALVKTESENVSAIQAALAGAIAAKSKAGKETEAQSEKLKSAEDKSLSTEVVYIEALASAKAIKDQLDALPDGDSTREALEQKLTEANKEVASALKTDKEAQAILGKAKNDLVSAESVLDNSDVQVKHEKNRLTTALEKEAIATKAANGAKADVAKARSKISDLKSEISALTALKAKLATDNLDLKTKKDMLESRVASITKLETDIAALETRASPDRDKLKAEQTIVDAGKTAVKEVKVILKEKGRYDAHAEDIALRSSRLVQQKTRRDQLAESDLFKSYDQYVADFKTLSNRIDAMEWLRARAMDEDQAFKHKQQNGQDTFIKRSKEAEELALTYLKPLCAEYAGFLLGETPEDAELSRTKLLSAMWRLYYSNQEQADSTGITCYYVAVQSGAATETFNAIDIKWKEVLTKVLGEERLKQATKLGSTDLVASDIATTPEE